jgi:flagellar hook assembly protein FlgD
LEIHTLAAYPNPVASAQTTLAFELRKSAETNVSVFDVNGKLVRTFSLGQLSTGKHELVWDLTADNGTKVAAGKYFAMMVSGTLKTKAYIIVQ